VSDSFSTLPRMPKTKKVLVVFLAGFLVFGATSAASARVLTPSEKSLLSVINSARTSHGLAPVNVDLRLVRAARAHTADMVRRQYFSHGAFTARARASGAAGPVFGEDLAWGPMSASWVVNQWLASPSHRAVLLRPGFLRIGVGAYQATFAGHPGALVVTADFAGR
jgi:uncharacterized protein YkwD